MWAIRLVVLTLTIGMAGCPGPRDDPQEPGSSRPDEASPTSFTEQGQLTLEVGGSASAHGMTLHLLGIRSDSRCPVDATCVWQGTVEAEIRVGWDGLLADTVIDLVRSNPIRFGTAHILHLVSVAPGPGPAGGPPQTDPYRLAFRIDHEPVQ